MKESWYVWLPHALGLHNVLWVTLAVTFRFRFESSCCNPVTAPQATPFINYHFLLVKYVYRVCHSFGTVLPWGPVWYKSIFNCRLGASRFYRNFLETFNKANLRDLIAATRLVVLLKLNSNAWFFILYDISSSVHYFKAISKFKLELQPGNAHFRSKFVFVLTIFFVLWDLEIWRMTLKNNRAPLRCYFKLCASFRSHLSIQTEVTVWNT